MPMKSDSAFMYAPARMLPASLRHDCSSASNAAVVPIGRRSSMSHSRRPTASGNINSVRPVKSPSMCISTAATTSCGFPSRSGTSSSRAMLIWGTLIMILRLVSCDSAVAAWPAPMLATSRSASICSSFRSRTSSMPPPPEILQQTARVENQRGKAVPHDGRPAEYRQGPLWRVERLHHDLLLAEHPVHDNPAAPLAHLEHDDRATDRGVAADAEEAPEVHERHDAILEHDRLATLNDGRGLHPELDRFRYVGERQRVALGAHARDQGPHDRERHRQPQHERRALP